jgi:hypothetical protein
MYQNWLHLTCKWATVGLNEDEFVQWQKQTTELNKYCPDCEEGFICESCHNTGLNFTTEERFIYRNLGMSLDKHSGIMVN